MALEPDLTALPERWVVPDRFQIADLGGGRSVLVDLDRLTAHEVLTEGADLLRRGCADHEAAEPGRCEFLATARAEGWIHGDDGSAR